MKPEPRSFSYPVDLAELGWQDDAACRRYYVAGDPRSDWWYPELPEDTVDARREYQRKVREAKRVCGGCPVRRQCLLFALDHHEPTGIWGGLTREERKSTRRIQLREMRRGVVARV